MSPTPRQRRAERHQQPGTGASTSATRRGPSGGTKPPITVDAIISTAFGIVEKEGYEALKLATRVLDSLQHHAWQGTEAGPCGPAQLPFPIGRLFTPAARTVAA